MHRTTLTFLFFLSVALLVWSYEAPEDKEDAFARTACPAFLTFLNKAYLSGTTVELPCLCKPGEVQTVIWFFRKHLSSSEQTEALTDDHGLTLVDPDSLPHSGGLKGRFSIRMFSLIVFRSIPDDSGIYICGSEKKDFFYAYDLDIQEARRITFHSLKQNNVSYAERLTGTFTIFQNWSMCDRCGRPAEQVRVGLCYVNTPYLHPRYQRHNHTVASCGSGAVLQVFGPIDHDGAELEVRNCEVVCPPEHTPPPKETSLMSFLGYSSAGGVKVFHLNHRAETILNIGCPGAKPNMAVAWDKEDTPIFRREHTVAPGGEAPRITIDTGHHLIFTPAEDQDSGVYYCWLERKPVAEIRVLVYSSLGRGQSVLTHPDLFPALKMVLISYAGMTGVFLLLLVTNFVILAIRGALTSHRD